ncbi:MAG: MBL fold metallo-hydrolase [Bacillota bacterium]
MRITVLGCWAPYPKAGGACSGYVLQDGAANVVIDMGNGSFSNLCQRFNFRTVRAVILTHLHPDHCADIECLRHALEGAMRDGSHKQGPVPLLLPKEPAEVAGAIGGKSQKAFQKIFIEDLPLEEVPPGIKARVYNVGPVRYYLLPGQHSLPSYSVGVEGSGYLVYTGDTAPTEDLALFAEKADILLCEASGYDTDQDYLRGVHMTARQAGELARKARAKELIITHFYPEYDLEKLRAEAAEGYKNNVEIATELDTYFVY